MHDRRTKKRTERLFTQPLNQLKLRMGACVLEIEGFLTGCHPTHEPLIKREAKLPDLIEIEPLGGAKNQLLAGLIMKVDRTDVGTHRRPHLSNDQH